MQEINNVNELANTIKKHMKNAVNSASFANGLSLGYKTTNGVIVDGHKNEYCGSDCLILNQITNTYSTEESQGHTHKFSLNDISTGDRVLVALLGTTCVIIGKVNLCG
ncbi:hypothetical protein [Clostridium sp.]|uniref:hypothetical protein n=1 Tax=Clostridium sp. TaxID=1506 RepID=UPI00290CE6F9|nr:hypothetical protein [Clostridium sp.]MDU4478630.1 hypothetical protein [Clostridium sp.]